MSNKLHEIRIELHEPHHGDDVYKKLHEKLEKAGYNSTVMADDIEYKMPRATYLKSAASGQASAICTEALNIAESVAAKGHAGVTVAECIDLRVKGLKKVEKATLASKIKTLPTKIPTTAPAPEPKILFSQYKAKQENK